MDRRHRRSIWSECSSSQPFPTTSHPGYTTIRRPRQTDFHVSNMVPFLIKDRQTRGSMRPPISAVPLNRSLSTHSERPNGTADIGGLMEQCMVLAACTSTPSPFLLRTLKEVSRQGGSRQATSPPSSAKVKQSRTTNTDKPWVNQEALHRKHSMFIETHSLPAFKRWSTP